MSRKRGSTPHSVSFQVIPEVVYFDRSPSEEEDLQESENDLQDDVSSGTSSATSTPRDLRVLSSYSNRAASLSTALEARDILMRKRELNRARTMSRGEGTATNKEFIDSPLEERKRELGELVVEIEMMDRIIKELEDKPHLSEGGSDDVLRKSLEDILIRVYKGDSKAMLTRMQQRLTVMKAQAIEAASAAGVIRRDPAPQKRSVCEREKRVKEEVGQRLHNTRKFVQHLSRRYSGELARKTSTPSRRPAKLRVPDFPDAGERERMQRLRSIFDANKIPTKDANSWLTRGRQREEISWISALRQYD